MFTIKEILFFIVFFILGYYVSKLWNNHHEKIPVKVGPTPWNVDNTTYMSDSGVCYKYKAHKLKCPSEDVAQIISV